MYAPDSTVAFFQQPPGNKRHRMNKATTQTKRSSIVSSFLLSFYLSFPSKHHRLYHPTMIAVTDGQVSADGDTSATCYRCRRVPDGKVSVVWRDFLDAVPPVAVRRTGYWLRITDFRPNTVSRNESLRVHSRCLAELIDLSWLSDFPQTCLFPVITGRHTLTSFHFANVQ